MKKNEHEVRSWRRFASLAGLIIISLTLAACSDVESVDVVVSATPSQGQVLINPTPTEVPQATPTALVMPIEGRRLNTLEEVNQGVTITSNSLEMIKYVLSLQDAVNDYATGHPGLDPNNREEFGNGYQFFDYILTTVSQDMNLAGGNMSSKFESITQSELFPYVRDETINMYKKPQIENGVTGDGWIDADIRNHLKVIDPDEMTCVTALSWFSLANGYLEGAPQYMGANGDAVGFASVLKAYNDPFSEHYQDWGWLRMSSGKPVYFESNWGGLNELKNADIGVIRFSKTDGHVFAVVGEGYDSTGRYGILIAHANHEYNELTSVTTTSGEITLEWVFDDALLKQMFGYGNPEDLYPNEMYAWRGN